MKDITDKIIDEALKAIQPKIENIGENLFKVTNGTMVVYTNQKGVDRILSEWYPSN